LGFHFLFVAEGQVGVCNASDKINKKAGAWPRLIRALQLISGRSKRNIIVQIIIIGTAT